eukprot:122374_1
MPLMLCRTKYSQIRLPVQTMLSFFVLLWLSTQASLQYRQIPNSPFVTLERPEYLDPSPDKELECNVRLLAYSYALSIQSYRGSSQPLTYDALQIDSYCNSTTKHKPKYLKYKNALNRNKTRWHITAPRNIDASIYTIYADPINGNNNNDGSLNSPVSTIQKALSLTRSLKSNAENKQIILRKGTFYIGSTIILSPQTFDNNLLITSYQNEQVWISGGVHLNINDLNW